MDAMGALLAPCHVSWPLVQKLLPMWPNCSNIKLQPNEVILKLDFQNAFHTIRHDKTMKAVKSLAPELALFVYSAYSKQSISFGGDKLCCLGRRYSRGTPCPLLFFLTIHKLTTHLEADLCMFKLEDSTLGESPKGVLHDLRVVKHIAVELCVAQNHKKFNVISHNCITRETLLTS